MNSRHTDEELMRPPRIPVTRTSSYNNTSNSNDVPDDEPGAISSSVSSSSNSSRSAAAGMNVCKGGINSSRASSNMELGDLDHLEKEISLARSRTTSPKNHSSSGSSGGKPSPPASAFRDRPWRTSSNTSPAAITTSPSDGSTGSNKDGVEKEETPTNGGTGLSSRWSQYETQDYEDESRRATSNAVVDVATRLADRQAREFEQDSLLLMGGATGSGNLRDHVPEVGRGSGINDLESVERLQSGGASLSAPEPYNYNSRSTTDYVKGRLSALLSPSHSNNNNNNNNNNRNHRSPSNNNSISTTSPQSEYDKVRSEAMKMLEIADRVETSPSNSITGLFKTSGGGYAMRQLDERDRRRYGTPSADRGGLSPSSSYRDDPDEASSPSRHHVASSIAGLEKYAMEKPNLPQYDGTFAIHSQDEEDPTSNEYGDHPNDKRDPNTNSKFSSSSWSSRYSVERQLMAITGGLNSQALCDKMDKLHYSSHTKSNNTGAKSARGLFRSSAAAMDGNTNDGYFTDYTSNSSTFGVEWGYFGGWWNYVKGTLWSEIQEENYDGTTQSLVRAEKRRRLRRRIWGGLIGLACLIVVVSVLVVMGNPKPIPVSSNGWMGEEVGEVTFYVIADEPYDFSNIGRLTLELESLPQDAEFLVHLGNANGDKQSQCQEYGYERSANILKESPVPVFVIPGDNDWATCRKPERALEWWSVNFGKFESNFKDSMKWNVQHQSDRVENFAFLRKGVLFLSVHIVEADTDSYEWTTRHERNVMWTKEKLSQYSKDDYRAMVIFGHAAPSSKQGEYFWPVVDQIKDLGKPVLYVHANAEGEFQVYRPFGEADNFRAVQLEKRGEEAPMKVVVGMGKGVDPFDFIRREPTVQ